MKTCPRLLLAALLTALSTAGLSAAPATPARTPVPVRIVHPTNLPGHYDNTVVELVFTLDAAGVPRDITTVKRQPLALTQQLIPAVAQWRFTPYLENGRPVPVRVVLPLRLVAGDYAALVEYPPLPGSPRDEFAAR